MIYRILVAVAILILEIHFIYKAIDEDNSKYYALTVVCCFAILGILWL